MAGRGDSVILRPVNVRGKVLDQTQVQIQIRSNVGEPARSLVLLRI